MTRTDVAHRRHGRKYLIICTLMAYAAVAATVGQNRSPAQEPDAVESARGISRAFRAAAKKVIPTVVKVKTITKARTIDNRDGRTPQQNPFKGTPFEDFFDDGQALPFRFHGRIPQLEGLGSGVIIDPTGVILTNGHVVEDADEVLIELADGRHFKATDIKTDAQSDLAVVRIKVNDRLPAATLGDSDAIEIGDWVLAVGNPFELDLSVSAGIISAKGRSLPSGTRANFLQTDAAINPGNSGGPLVNLDGEVVGINTAIASNSGVYQGVGFAIPANLAKWVTAQLIKNGSVQRAYLGVSIEEIDGPVAQKLGVASRKGVLVSEVPPNTPAAAAGVHEGDIITAYAGKPVSNRRQLQEFVERSPAGSKQLLEILRDGRPTTLAVTVQRLPEDFGARAERPRADKRVKDPAAFEHAELGLEVTELTEERAQRLGYKGFSGVLITAVSPTGVAAQAGLREGMLILRVGKKAVRSVAEFREAMKAESLQESILLLVRTPDGNRFVVLQAS